MLRQKTLLTRGNSSKVVRYCQARGLVITESVVFVLDIHSDQSTPMACIVSGMGMGPSVLWDVLSCNVDGEHHRSITFDGKTGKIVHVADENLGFPDSNSPQK